MSRECPYEVCPRCGQKRVRFISAYHDEAWHCDHCKAFWWYKREIEAEREKAAHA
jgi:ribosomal protein L37AE/L43A